MSNFMGHISINTHMDNKPHKKFGNTFGCAVLETCVGVQWEFSSSDRLYKLSTAEPHCFAHVEKKPYKSKHQHLYK